MKLPVLTTRRALGRHGSTAVGYGLLGLGVAACCAAKPASSPTTPVSEPAASQPTVEPMIKPAHPPRTWPETKRQDIVETLFGKQVADPYRWLEDEKAPDVQAWMTAQDEYARKAFAALPGRDALAARLKEVFYYDAVSAPIRRGKRLFYTRKHANKEKSIVYWKDGDNGTETVLLDPNTMSADGTVGVGGWWPSEDGKYVAWAKKANNADETTTLVMEVATGKMLKDTIEGTKYSGASWTPDGKGFYYTWVPPVGGEVTVAERPGFAEVRYHKLGQDPTKDELVHPKTGNAETFLGGYVSKDGHWLIITVQHGWNSGDVYFKDLRQPKSKFVTLAAGTEANYEVYPWRDAFYVTTNEGAPKSRVFKVDPKKPERTAWREIVPESADATLEGTTIVGEHLVLNYLRNAASVVQVHDMNGKFVRNVEVPALGTAGAMVGEPDQDTGYLAYSSFTEPQVIYQTSLKTGATKEWARVKLPIDTSQFVTEQVFFPSKDGTKISMFLIHKKGVSKDAKQPTILYGYGGFQVNMTPSFSSSRVVWLEQGGVYAIPNLRGGAEYGEAWHRDGMQAKKQNVFDDYIAAAQYLIKEGWTSPAHLAISGGSNGGLLVGAAMTQAPELFRAVICAVPLLDMLRYHQFGSGKTWIPEYGSAETAAEFSTLWSYSPYRRAVDEGARSYPALLMDAADHDDRVDPMHARKFVAQVQFAQRSAAPVYLRIERNAGHGGADSVKQAVDRIADQFAFLLSQLR